jgi:hypothetical protein
VVGVDHERAAPRRRGEQTVKGGAGVVVEPGGRLVEDDEPSGA